MLKELRIAFPDAANFSRACDLLATDDKLTVADITAKLAAEVEAARVTKLEADFAALNAALTAKDAEITQLKADVAAAAKGADPINLGSEASAPVDAAKIVEQYLKLSGDEAQAFLAKNFTAIDAHRKGHGIRCLVS